MTVQIDPAGYETAYEFRLVWQDAHPPARGESFSGEMQAQKGRITTLAGPQTASATAIGLRAGYTYWYKVGAINTLGKTLKESSFGFLNNGEYPNGEGTGPPFTEGEFPVFQEWQEEHESRSPSPTASEQEALHAKELQAAHAKEQEQQRIASEAAAEAAADQRRKEEQEESKGGLVLAAKSIPVNVPRTAHVAIKCLGSEACHGKLTLLSKAAATSRHKPKHHAPIILGEATFTITGDAQTTVKVHLSTAAARLLTADHGHLSASLLIEELPRRPHSTLLEAVQLTQSAARRNS
jgi:hypothetical protein